MFSKTAFSSMTQAEAEKELSLMIQAIQGDLLGGLFCTFEREYTVVPIILLESDKKFLPNASLTPVSKIELGVSVNGSLLALEDTISILFTLGHELGHAYTETVLREIDCLGINGTATEVVADVSSVLFLHIMGIDLQAINESISKWHLTNIFDLSASGDHPAGEERYKWIALTIERLKRGDMFANIVKDIVSELNN